MYLEVLGGLSQLSIDSLFGPRSQSQGHEIEHYMGLHAQQGVCLRFSLSHSLSLYPSICSYMRARTCTLTLSRKYINKY